MKAKLVLDLPAGDDWVYEIKFDGVRCCAVRSGKTVHLYSRNRIDRAARYPEIAQAVRMLECESAVLDGEIVALDAKGRSSFQLLQGSQGESDSARAPILCYLFDIMQLDGRDLRGFDLLDRKSILSALISAAGDPLRYSAHFTGSLSKIRKQAKTLSLEGIMAKRTESHYESGRRSGSWAKWKTVMRQEFVIGGYTPPSGSRTHFGALLVGYYHEGILRFASKVGTGFNSSLLGELHRQFQKLKTEACPFSNLPEKKTSRGGLGRSEMARCTWLKPQLVCEVKFQEWTSDGHLRQPVFLGIREDKKPKQVGRERPSSRP